MDQGRIKDAGRIADRYAEVQDIIKVLEQRRDDLNMRIKLLRDSLIHPGTTEYVE